MKHRGLALIGLCIAPASAFRLSCEISGQYLACTREKQKQGEARRGGLGRGKKESGEKEEVMRESGLGRRKRESQPCFCEGGSDIREVG